MFQNIIANDNMSWKLKEKKSLEDRNQFEITIKRYISLILDGRLRNSCNSSSAQYIFFFTLSDWSWKQNETQIWNYTQALIKPPEDLYFKSFIKLAYSHKNDFIVLKFYTRHFHLCTAVKGLNYKLNCHLRKVTL